MCGILAVIHKVGRLIEPVDLRPMLAEMSHRGNDQQLISHYKTCDVGFNRLSITDRDVPQPGGKKIKVFLNGEVYNYRELGYAGTECEVISDGIEKEGPDFIEKLNGMFFILAVHDDYVLVARDRWGQKPVYWWDNGHSIIVSSEIKPILKHPDFKTVLNTEARKQLLTFNNIFTDETLFRGIRKMDKGTWWMISNGVIAKKKYWQWDFTPEKMEYEEAKEEVRRLLTASVKRQTPDEVEYGSCLSGGIDSSLIVALCGDIKTFTVGYKGQEDERHLAGLMGKQQYEIVYDRVRNLHETIKHLEVPLLGASWMHYDLYQLASKFVKVLFDGAGSDELFFGYHWRHSAENYWDVVNRTKIENEYCYHLFDSVYLEDTPEARYTFDANYFLEGVLLVCDRISMAHTIELRTPFLDNDLADFATKIPYHFKRNKKILKEAFKDLLPVEIRLGSKRGFTTPSAWIPGTGNQAHNWINEALRVWEEIFLNNR